MNNKKIWIYGKNTVFSALSNKKTNVYEIQILNKNLFKEIDQKYYGITNVVSEKVFLKNVIGNLAHQGIGAKIDSKKNNEISDIQGNAILLDNLYDHRNIGAIIRSCIAFGIENIIIEKKNLSLGSQLMYKTASGAVENINFFLVTNISNSISLLKKKNYTIIAIDGSSDVNIFENKKIIISEKIVFIFGSEDTGIRKLVKQNSDYIFKIPITNIDSLNVSSAVSSVLTLYSFFKTIN